MGSNTGVGEPHSPDGESGRHAAVQVAAAANALRWRQEFPGEERQLGVVRRWLASLLPECPARDDVISVATELGSNALRHTASGRGGLFAVEVTWHESIVRVAVADGGGPTRPRVIEDLAAEQGRGLLLVSGLSVRSGATGDHRGRLVWADITWDGPDAPAHALAQDSYETAIRDGQTALARHFADVPVWFGRSTLAWWALAGPDELVTAPTAGELPICCTGYWMVQPCLGSPRSALGSRSTETVAAPPVAGPAGITARRGGIPAGQVSRSLRRCDSEPEIRTGLIRE